MKQFIEKFKTLWANRRYRAILVLGMYIAFFGFVFFILSLGNKQPVKIPVTGIDLFSTKTTYRYTILGNENLEYIITDNKVNYENIQYSLNELPEELKKYDIDYFTPKNIYNLIKNSTLESTNYLDKMDTYVMDMDNINTNTIEKKEYGKFRIMVYKNEENINKVVIDLLDYNGYKYMIMV